MKSTMIFLLLASAVCPAPVAAQAKFTEVVRVRLLAPLRTDLNRPGDQVTVMVVSPGLFRDDIVEGILAQSRSSGSLTGSSVLMFNFQVLYHGGAEIPVKSLLRSVTNSKGKKNLDEEGRAVRKNNAVKRSVVLAAVCGGITGGVTLNASAALKMAAICGGASLGLTRLAGKGPALTFESGSEFEIEMRNQ
jgi:hypothetical protein